MKLRNIFFNARNARLARRTRTKEGYLYVVYSRKNGLDVYSSNLDPEAHKHQLQITHGAHFNVDGGHFFDIIQARRNFIMFHDAHMKPRDALYEAIKLDIIGIYACKQQIDHEF